MVFYKRTNLQQVSSSVGPREGDKCRPGSSKYHDDEEIRILSEKKYKKIGAIPLIFFI